MEPNQEVLQAITPGVLMLQDNRMFRESSSRCDVCGKGLWKQQGSRWTLACERGHVLYTVIPALYISHLMFSCERCSILISQRLEPEHRNSNV